MGSEGCDATDSSVSLCRKGKNLAKLSYWLGLTRPVYAYKNTPAGGGEGSKNKVLGHITTHMGGNHIPQPISL